MNTKCEIAEDAAKLALKEPGATKDAVNAITTAGRLFEDIMSRSMTGTVINAVVNVYSQFALAIVAYKSASFHSFNSIP